MEQEMIDTLIDKYTHMITTNFVKTVRKLVILFFVLSTCFLLALRSYIFVVVLFVLLASELVYLSVIIKKDMLTIYSGVGVSVVLCGDVVLFFNVSLYSAERLIGIFDPILLLVVFSMEVLCLISGFFYTRRCVRKGIIRQSYASVTASTAFVLPGMFGYFLSRYISNKTSIQIQSVFFTTIFALSCCVMMFVLGMVHIAIIYYIKKYNIRDRALSIKM